MNSKQDSIALRDSCSDYSLSATESLSGCTSRSSNGWSLSSNRMKSQFISEKSIKYHDDLSDNSLCTSAPSNILNYELYGSMPMRIPKNIERDSVDESSAIAEEYENKTLELYALMKGSESMDEIMEEWENIQGMGNDDMCSESSEPETKFDEMNLDHFIMEL
mmetsp:Transcript_35115/g.35752  ORF Transcript_35115/g.35752 Transcript_35115/m.35752 type:complete len:163 (+) Transcript_35115:142-630(+)